MKKTNARDRKTSFFVRLSATLVAVLLVFPATVGCFTSTASDLADREKYEMGVFGTPMDLPYCEAEKVSSIPSVSESTGQAIDLSGNDWVMAENGNEYERVYGYDIQGSEDEEHLLNLFDNDADTVWTATSSGGYVTVDFKTDVRIDRSEWILTGDGETDIELLGFSQNKWMRLFSGSTSAGRASVNLSADCGEFSKIKAVFSSPVQVAAWNLQQVEWRDGENIALGCDVEVDSVFSNGNPDHFTPDNIVDGHWLCEETDEWVSGYSTSTHWAVIDLGEVCQFNKYNLFSVGASGYGRVNLGAWSLDISTDGQTWERVSSVSDNLLPIYEEALPKTVIARYVRLTVTDGGNGDACVRVFELQITNAEKIYRDLNILDWNDAIPAEVPASIHTNLINAGLLDDPYIGHNDSEAFLKSKSTWWLRKEFVYEGEPTGNETLAFDGVCNQADFYLNGQKLGYHEGMFGGPYFDIGKYLKNGLNTLVIKLSPATAWQETAVFNCSYGWHYACIWPLGVWQGVSIEDDDGLRVENSFVSTYSVSQNSAVLDYYADVPEYDGTDGELYIEIKPKNFSGSSEYYKLNFNGSDKYVRARFTLDNAQLWWPAGYGAQNLYTVRSVVKCGDEVKVCGEETIGIRTVEWLPADGRESGYLYNWRLSVNGRDVFIKGTGWCTTDAIMRFTEERYRQQIDRAAEQGVNFMRAWGSGMPETDTFYELCDEKGLMILQEWPTAWDSFASQDKTALYETVKLNTIRIRNHPSLVMYGGGNENAMQADLTPLKEMGRITYENDGTRVYHLNEPWGGSIHNYDPYWGGGELDVYFKLPETTPFIGEYGNASLMNRESIAKFATEEEMAEWPISYDNSISHHTPKFGAGYSGNSPIGDLGILMRFASQFVCVENLDDLIFGSQIAQTVSLRHAIDDARTLRNVSSGGICFYKSNDVYPGATWATIDWYGSPKMAHYFVQDAYMPLTSAVIAEKQNYYGQELVQPVWIFDDQNELEGKNWKVSVKAYNSEMELIKAQDYEGSGALGESYTKSLGDFTLTAEQTSTAPLIIMCDTIVEGQSVARNYYWYNCIERVGALQLLGKTQLTYHTDGDRVTVTNIGDVPAVGVKIEVGDSSVAVLSDNYFWLNPGETKTVTVEHSTVSGVSAFNLKADDDSKPQTPVSRGVKTDENSAKLVWSGDDSAEYYLIYKDGNVVDKLHGSVTSYTAEGLQEGTHYSFGVVAVSAGDVRSDMLAYDFTFGEDDGTPAVTDVTVETETVTVRYDREIDISEAEACFGELKLGITLSADKKALIVDISSITNRKTEVLYIFNVKAADQPIYATITDIILEDGEALKLDFEGENPLVSKTDGTTEFTPSKEVEYTSGKSDGSQAALFDGTKDTGLTADGFAADLSGDFTISAVFRCTGQNSGTNYVILSKGPKIAGHYEMYIEINTGFLRFWAYDLNIDLVIPVDLRDSEWHCGTVTRKGDTLALWLDDSHCVEAQVSGSITATDYPLAIGYVDEPMRYGFCGAIDSVCIYERALDKAEFTDAQGATYRVCYFDGSKYIGLTVEEGGKLTIPAPHKSGYDFVGWKKAGAEELYDMTLSVEEDLILVPVWTESEIKPSVVSSSRSGNFLYVVFDCSISVENAEACVGDLQLPMKVVDGNTLKVNLESLAGRSGIATLCNVSDASSGALADTLKIVVAYDCSAGHHFGEWYTETGATCTHTGSYVRKCTECGYTETCGIEEMGHSFGDWQMKKPATYTEDGIMISVCEHDGAIRTQRIEKLGLVKKLQDEVAAISVSSDRASRFEALRLAVETYGLLTDEERAEAGEAVSALKGYIEEYNTQTQTYCSEVTAANHNALTVFQKIAVAALLALVPVFLKKRI